MLFLSIVCKTEEDSIIWYSRTRKAPAIIQLSEPEFEGDIMEGYALLSTGDSASFISNAASFFTRAVKSEVPDFIKPGSKLIFDVRLVKVQTKADFRN